MVLRHGTSYEDSKEILVTEDSEDIWKYIDDFQKGKGYHRSWLSNDYLVIDYGSHFYFFYVSDSA